PGVSSEAPSAPARRSGASAVKARLAEELAKGNGVKPNPPPRAAVERESRPAAEPERYEGPPPAPPEAYDLPPPEAYGASLPEMAGGDAAPIGPEYEPVDERAASPRGWDGRWTTLIQAADVRG